MTQFNITGMSCAACSARVEKAVSDVDGVSSCSVNLLTNSMTVEGTAANHEIIKAVEAAGYGANLKGSKKEDSEGFLEDKETPYLKRRFVASIIFLAILMYVSMGHVMWGFPVPQFFDRNYIGIGILELLLTLIVMFINKRFFISGTKGLINRAPNMDTLVSLGSGAAFIYSTYALFAMTGARADAYHYLHEFYFESAAMILALITVGKMLEARSKGKTTNALRSLMKLAPKTAIIEVGGAEKEIEAKDIKKGDIFIVKSGMSFPADGIVVSGHCAVDESAITGESIPVDKEMGDRITSATINKSGYVRCRAEKVGADTTLSQIIKLVSDASATKAPIAKAADKVSSVFVPVVMAIALITIIVWLASGESIGFALARGISVLVISCPCALGLATPVAIMVASGVGAKNSILFKTAVSLEEAGKISVVALDKTGTITKGEPVVTDIITADGIEKVTLLRYAYALEAKSEHPLARAVVKRAEELNVELFESTDFNVSSGNGIEATVGGAHVVGGNLHFISKFITIPGNLVISYEQLAEKGCTPLFFIKDKQFLGIIAVADAIKEDSHDAIKELKNMGIRVVMLTGDNETTATAVKTQVDVDEVIANVTPAGKDEVIKKLKQNGKVAMVGDGINDAPALTSADIGIAIGAGTDIAIDAADIVLMKNSISDVPAAIRLSRMTLKNIYENLFWAFIYNTIGIPVAAGVLIPAFGIQLNPMIAAAAMSLSSFCVVTNALRLNFKDIKSAKHDMKIRAKKEKKTMEITLKIEGMMCPHCEARVKSTLEAIDGVLEVIPSHTEKQAKIILSKEIDISVLKDTIVAQGYQVID
ncbi:MAG: heavy metal translocating P-type ATPase [Clostridia bacterium]|nr:heavy metal translocating P-type ATPase [Clostridia bacterium]